MGQVVTLAHGDGGVLTSELVAELFVRRFDNKTLSALTDSAVLGPHSGRIALTTDSFVVSPLFFPGGDIGRLAVCGTVNDLAVCGARPIGLAASFIIEEGLPLEALKRVAGSMAMAAREAGTQLVTGDTKVVERGHADKLFITTSGAGIVEEGIELGYGRIVPGDAIIINGPIGEHGLAVLSRRQGLEFDSPVASDCAPINQFTVPLLERLGTEVRFMRDPTRGGLATAVVEMALAAGIDVLLREDGIPVTDAVAGGAEMLGLDPLYLANEGKFIAVVSAHASTAAVDFLKGLGCLQASVIGEVLEGTGKVHLRTSMGATRRLERLSGEQLPRIC